MAGSGRQRRTVVNRQGERGQGNKQSTADPKSGSTHQHGGHGSSAVQRLKELQATLGNKNVNNLLEKKAEAVTDPALRESLTSEAMKLFEQTIDRLPQLVGVTAPLLGMTPMPGGGMPDPTMAIQAHLAITAELAQLDNAIHLYERAGGDIIEIRPIIAIRAQLSTALFFVQQMLAGAPLGAQVFDAVSAALLEGAMFRQEQAVKKTLSGAGTVEEGPRTEVEHQKKLVLGNTMRLLFLGPPGLFPSANNLKS